MRFFLSLFIETIALIMLIVSAAKAGKDEKKENPLQQEFKWVNLTDEQLKEWYTPTDLCALKFSETTGFPQEIRSKNCSEFSRKLLLIQNYELSPVINSLFKRFRRKQKASLRCRYGIKQFTLLCCVWCSETIF